MLANPMDFSLTPEQQDKLFEYASKLYLNEGDRTLLQRMHERYAHPAVSSVEVEARA
jgi:hypothetical protein